MNNGWLGDHVHNHRIGFSYLYFVISSWWHAFLFLSTDSELVIHLLWLLTSELLYDQALSVANTVGSVAYEERQTHEWMDWWIRSCGWLRFYSLFFVTAAAHLRPPLRSSHAWHTNKDKSTNCNTKMMTSTNCNIKMGSCGTRIIKTSTNCNIKMKKLLWIDKT